MKPAEIAAGAESSGGTQASDGLDQYRNALTPADFRRIDKDGSNSLTVDELTESAKDNSFTKEKKDAIGGLADHLRSAPKQNMRFGKHEIPVQPVITQWFKGPHPGTGGGGGGSDKTLDLGKDDPLANKAEKPKPTEEQLREKLETLGSRLAQDLPKNVTSNEGRTFSAMMDNYDNIQVMWTISKNLPGDPMKNMEAAMNRAIGSKGHSVKLHKTDEPCSPQTFWMSSIDAYMTIDPPAKPPSNYHERYREKMGSGVIGLRRRYE